jgi:translocation and assembly module TamB
MGAGLLRLPQLQATLAQGGRVAGSGFVNLKQRTYAVQLKSEGMTLAALGAERLKASGLSPATPIDVKVSGAGKLASPTADVNFGLGAFTYQEQAFGASRINASLSGDHLAVDGALFQNQVKVTGTVPLKGKAEGAIALRFDRARLDPLFAMAPPGTFDDVEAPKEGLLTGTVTLKGPFTDPERVEAEVDLSLLRIAYENIMLANQGPIRLSFADKVLHVKQFHVLGPDTDLTIRGRVGLGVPSNLNLDGRLNLALLEKVAPKTFADASGGAVLEAQLQGTLGQPDLVGALSLKDGEFMTRNLPQAIRDVNGSVRMVRDKIFLDGLSATLGYSGRVQAFGGATLGKDFMPTQVNLQVNAREVEVRTPDVRVLANADLSFSGTPNFSRLDGQVRVLEGRYTQNIDLTGRLASRAGRSGSAAPGSIGAMPFLKNLALRVQTVIPDQFMIKNNLAEGELRGDLVVLGTATRPVIVGRAEALSGRVTFQDRVYTLEEASVDFVDPHKIVPYAHVIATTSAQGYDIRVQANGTPDSLQLDLTSTPFLPQSDVLTLLATGQTPAQLQAGGGEGIATAGNFLLGQVAKGVERGVTGQGVVDVLKIQPGSVNPAQPGGGSFTVGKRLSDKLMVTYTQDIAVAPGETPGRVVIFDYLLTDEVVLKLEQNLGGGFNGSARYRFTVR